MIFRTIQDIARAQNLFEDSIGVQNQDFESFFTGQVCKALVERLPEA